MNRIPQQPSSNGHHNPEELERNRHIQQLKEEVSKFWKLGFNISIVFFVLLVTLIFILLVSHK
jgi:hypothetical protein